MFDDAMRAFRSYLPDATTDDDARAVAQRVIERARTRTVAPRIRRRGIAVAAASGLAAVGALALVATRVDRQPSLTTPIVVGTPRVDWGMRAVVTVTPDPGVSVEDATQRTKELLGERLKKMDVQGAEVSVPKPGQLSLKVPGASNRWQISKVATIPHVQVFPADQVLAQGTRLADLKRQMGPIPAGGPRAYLVEFSRPSVGTVAPIARLASRNDVRNATRGISAGEFSVVEIPASWSLVTNWVTKPVHIVLDGTPIPSDSLSLSVRKGQPTITYPVRGPGTVGDEVVIVATGELPQGVPQRLLNIGTVVIPDTVTTEPDGTLRHIGFTARTRVADPLNGALMPIDRLFRSEPKSLNATVTFISYGRYGKRPPEGTSVTAPTFLRSLVGADTSTRWRRVLQGSAGSTHLSIFTWTDGANGQRAGFQVTRPGRITGSTLFTTRYRQSNEACPPDVGAPIIVSCLEVPFVAKNLRAPVIVLAVGRVGPEVARIEVKLPNGRTVPGIVDDTWFAVVYNGGIAVADRKSYTLKAYDQNDRELKSLTVPATPPPVPAP